MIPHGSCDIDRRCGLPHGIKARAEHTTHSADLMALNAAFLTEKFSARLCFSHAFEIILGKKKRNEIPSLGSIYLGQRLMALVHPRRHCGKMIPHGSSEIIEGPVCLNSPQVG